jgi:hypothetical protein
MPLIGFFHDIEEKYPVKFYFKNEWFIDDSISLSLDNTPLTRALDRITDAKPFIYQIVQGNMVVFMPKEDVAMLLGQMIDMDQGFDLNIISVGNPNEAGKFKKVELKGKVKDGKSGEPLIGANLQIEKTTQGCVSNVSGNYSLIVAPGIYNLIVTSIGYEKAIYKVKIISNGSLDFELFEKSLKIDEIAIYAQRPDKNVRSSQMSLVEMDAKSIKQLPSLTGEKDILKSFTMMPGVKSVGEFGSGINVRGGGEDQNLYLIEGAPIYNTSHVFGLMSVINPDIVNNVTLYKGHIPANYGERVSSVMDIQVKDNNCKVLRAKGGIGLYNSRLMFEGPITNENLTFKIGGRTSYSDWLLKRIPDYYLQNSSASFYDINAFLNWNFKNNRITVFAYNSQDKFNYAHQQAYNYGNTLGSVNWSHFFNQNLSSLLTLAYSQYDASKDELQSVFEKSRIASQIKYASVKYNVKYNGINHHTIDGGLQVIRYQVQPGKKSPLDSSSLIPIQSLSSQRAIEDALYVNDLFDINEHFAINAGLRFSGYYLLGPQTILDYKKGYGLSPITVSDSVIYKKNNIVQSYYGIEPRLSFKIQFNERNSVKLSYNRNDQYISLISYSSISTPNDVWKLSDTYMKPIISDQYAIGYYRNFKNNIIETSIEVYYKKLSNLTEYKNDANIEMNEHLETELINASGKNYGVELLLKKNKGKLDGWISYTYSRSLKKTNGYFPEEKINNNTYYPSSYDKPHDLTITGTYHINRRWRFAGNFSYSTGRAVTLPEIKYTVPNDMYSIYKTISNEIIYYSDRNKYRLPDYHRLDLSLSMDESLRIRKKWKGSWTFSVLNVYARKNAYSVFYKKEEPTKSNNYNTFSLYKLYLIGQPLPTLTYNFIF